MAGNRRWKRLVCLLFVLLTWGASPILAAVPAEINYQGSIEDLSGPVDGTLDLTFRLFDADVAGAIVWEEAHSVLVDQGIYNVILGTGTANPSYGSLEEAVFENDDLWLEVEVVGEADAMAPRQKITSVGFALRAGSVSDGTITATMLADDAVTTDKLVDGAVTAAKVTGGFVPNLDADLLDGQSAEAFSQSGHNHDTRYYTQPHVDALEDRIAALEAKLEYLTVVAGNVNGMAGPHVMITGANLHVRSGSGSTDGTINGTGNLIIGYNELRGTGDDRSGSHNIVAGKAHNYSSYGGIVVAYNNSISAPWASVNGGRSNTASGLNSSVHGGYSNTASYNYSNVSGGAYNEASGNQSSICGGVFNIASQQYSSVSGGDHNNASAYGSSVSGGSYNNASGQFSSVSGGRYNTASGEYSFIGGGGSLDPNYGNEAFSHYSAILGGGGNIAGDNSDPDDHSAGPHATISGGIENTASGYFSSVSGGQYNHASARGASISGGRYNKASGEYSFIGGGGGAIAQDGNVAVGHYTAILGGLNNLTGDGVSVWIESLGRYVAVAGSNHTIGERAVVSGGEINIASGPTASISGGYDNAAIGERASINGGRSNQASGQYSSVSGGSDNTASGRSASVSGGNANQASGRYSSISGGAVNMATVESSSVSGGQYNQASNRCSSVSGGYYNTAAGVQSSVSGGGENTAAGSYGSVSGGWGNQASGDRSSVSGGTGRSATDIYDWRAGHLFSDQ